jgi:hypothetical protein
MTRRKAAAEEREKKLWGQKGFLLKQEDYSFMGDEDKWSMKTARKLAYKNPALVMIAVVLAVFVLYHLFSDGGRAIGERRRAEFERQKGEMWTRLVEQHNVGGNIKKVGAENLGGGAGRGQECGAEGQEAGTC